jgi:hypothetical protein
LNEPVPGTAVVVVVDGTSVDELCGDVVGGAMVVGGIVTALP